MALRDKPPISRGDNTSIVTGEQGNPLAQGEKNEQITRQGAAAAEADFDVDGHNLSDSDWFMPDSTDLTKLPDIGGTSAGAIWIVSSNDNPFEVEIEPKNDLGGGNYTDLGVIDKNVNSRLSSVSPRGKNHHIFETIEVVSDVIKVTIKNTNAPGQNVINGSINFH